MSRQMRIFAIIVAAIAIFLGGWMLIYPSPDPKSIQYILWKADLLKMNLDKATDTMIGDASSQKLVVGKTKAQLRAKFGLLVPPEDASPYLRGCYQNSGWKDREVLFLRHSPWIVVFDGDKATDLILIKGC